MSEQRIRTILTAVLAFLIMMLVVATIYYNEFRKSEPLDEGIVRLGDIPVAQVNGTAIYESTVKNVAVEQGKITQNDVLTSDDPIFQDILQQLIDQRILALAALERSLDQEAAAKRRLAQARERILGNVLIEDHLQKTVTEESIRAMFDAQAALRQRGTEIRARQIQLEDEESAKNIVARLDKGESFESLALAFSTDRASREDEGDLGYFTDDMLSPEFTRKIWSAKVGARLPIFKTSAGWHVVEVLDRRQVPEPKFDEVKASLTETMTYNEIKTLLDGLRAKADIKRLSHNLTQPETENP